MITKTIQYTINNGTAPWSYAFSSTDSCVTFSNATGSTTSGTITTTATFADEDCLANSTITLSVTDSLGCAGSTTVTVDNDCDNLVLNAISQEGDYKFNTSASATGCGSVTFNWYYDNALFNLVTSSSSPFASTITLQPSSSVTSYPTSSNITVIATDCNDCEETQAYTVTFCQPEVSDLDVTLYCNATGTGYVSGDVNFIVPSNCSSTIDWDTLDIDLPTGISFTNVENVVTFTGTLTATPGTYIRSYSVETEDGINSTTGTITFTIVACSEARSIYIPDKTIYIDCTVYSGGETIEINIEDEIVLDTGKVIDWSTWTLVDPPTPQSPSIVLTTNTDGDHVFEYDITSPIIPDVFAWTVCTTDGECANTTTYTLMDCPTTPIAVADSDCTTCGNSVTIDVLANDVDGGTPFDILTVTPDTPTSGTAVANADGTITYTAPTTEVGTPTFNYTVDNTSGVTSNSVQVDVDVACAGDSNSKSICIPAEALQTPYDDLSGSTRTGGTWSWVSGPGSHPTPPVLYNDSIDFTGYSDGSYVYRYTSTCLTCNDTADVTYVVGSQTSPSNDECATAASISYGSAVPATSFLFARDDEQCPGLSLPTLSAESVPVLWTLTPAHDIWFTVTLPDPSLVGVYNFTVTVDGSEFGVYGIDRPMLGVYGGNTCGGKKFVDAGTATAQTISRTVVMDISSELIWYFRVASATGNEGQFRITVDTY